MEKSILKTSNGKSNIQGLSWKFKFFLIFQNCTRGETCHMVQQLKRGSEVWKPKTNTRCDRKMRKQDREVVEEGGEEDNTRWKCFFAPQTFGFIDCQFHLNLFQSKRVLITNYLFLPNFLQNCHYYGLNLCITTKHIKICQEL